MNSVRKNVTRAWLGPVAAALMLGLVAAACSTQPGNSVLSPSGISGGSLFELTGGDTCDQVSPNVKVNAVDQNSVSYNASPDTITAICIKAGQTTGLLITADVSNGCYTVTGIGTSSVQVTRVGSGKGCQGLSHVRFYTTPAPPPPPPPPPPCDPEKDPKCEH